MLTISHVIYKSNLHKKDCLNKAGRPKVQETSPVQEKTHNYKM